MEILTMLRNRVLIFLIVGFLFFLSQEIIAQKLHGAIVAFYNIENLFDTINTPNVRDGEFTPEGPKNWNSEKYWEKIDNLGHVISQLGVAEGFEGPAVIGLCEMENRAVLVDLVNSPSIKENNYQIVHYDSPDDRGIDVALLYQPNLFTVTSTRSVPLLIKGDDGNRLYTRDQLVVSGLFDDEPMHFVVNHWPSRYGGEERSRGNRVAAARLTRSLVDSIVRTDANAKVIVMGDLNDDPTNESVRLYLKARQDKNRLKKGQLFNATEIPFKQGKGTLAYRGKWNMFDQMILTPSLVDKNNKGYQFHSVHVYTHPKIVQQTGNYKGYPHRTYVGNKYMGGYSDHFPVYILLMKEE
ncbi:MAG TPA: endonuclease/exonuclease/phosphatase family protein [Marinilabiliaceae bacterium]|nr:endonuclease/exonuclease/phosphatase family protein [Marinilabiliaceae bacterium]